MSVVPTGPVVTRGCQHPGHQHQSWQCLHPYKLLGYKKGEATSVLCLLSYDYLPGYQEEGRGSTEAEGGPPPSNSGPASQRTYRNLPRHPAQKSARVTPAPPQPRPAPSVIYHTDVQVQVEKGCDDPLASNTTKKIDLTYDKAHFLPKMLCKKLIFSKAGTIKV